MLHIEIEPIYQKRKAKLYFIPLNKLSYLNVSAVITTHFINGLRVPNYYEVRCLTDVMHHEYQTINTFIDQFIDTNDNVAIIDSLDPYSNAIVIAFLINKQIDLEFAQQLLQQVNRIEIPEELLQSLITYSTLQQNNNSLLLNTIQPISLLMSTSMVSLPQQSSELMLEQSELQSFPLFSQRLIEKSQYSCIFDSSRQIQSKILDNNSIMDPNVSDEASIGEFPNLSVSFKQPKQH